MKNNLKKEYSCKYCNKKINDNSNHIRHEKTCKVKKYHEEKSIEINIDESKEDETSVLMKIIKQQQEQLNILKKQNISKPITGIKPQFNLKSYLNEICKDAINILDFLNDFTVSDNEFIIIGMGDNFRENINYINTNNIKKYSSLILPFHTSCLKEKTIWIKGDLKTIKIISESNKFKCIDNVNLHTWIKADVNDMIQYWKLIEHIIMIKAIEWYKKYCKYGCAHSYDNIYNNSIINLMAIEYNDKYCCSELINYLLKEIVIDKKEYLK